jgi:hypothetical protein
LASLLSNVGLNELTFFSEFSKANETGFSSRNTKITNANLWNKIKNKELNPDEVTKLYGFDRVCLNGVVNSYIVLMINPFVPEEQQIDTGEDLADKLDLLSAAHKNDISVTLMQRFENFFFDNSTPPADLTTAGTTIFGIKIFKMDQTNQDFVNRPSIPNMIYIPDNFTAVESEDVLIKKYKSINPNLVKEEDIRKRERVIFMELGSVKHRNFEEKFDFF